MTTTVIFLLDHIEGSAFPFFVFFSPPYSPLLPHPPPLPDGMMYWTDWGSSPKIERAWMNGENRQMVVDRDLIWPNGLAIDHQQGRLYWVDAGTKMIEYASKDGRGRRVSLWSGYATNNRL